MKYVPSSLILSENDPKRDFFSRKIRDREKKDYDYKTVFYDAVHIEGSSVIQVFGPPMLNLIKELGQPVFFIESKYCRWSRRVGSFGKFEEWTIIIPRNVASTDFLTILFSKNQTYQLKINHVSRQDSYRLLLTAIQKNNRIRWINDWHHYYRDTFGVERLVLYDNGSTVYEDNLEKLLHDDSIVVQWDFPYGPSISHDNKFTQIGALNHCRMVFGRNARIFSFDIDEILVDPRGVIRRDIDRYAVHYVSSYFVPHTDKLGEDYSFASYTRRRRQPHLTGKKYVYHANRSTGVLPHYVHSHRIRFFDDVTIFLKKGINSIRWRNNQINNWKVIILGFFLRIVTLGKRQKNYSLQDAYFLHFRGITTNWKNRGNRLSVEDDDELVDDDFLIS